MTMTRKDVQALLKAKCAEEGGQKVIAGRLGCSSAFVSMVANGTKPPPLKILNMLGLRRVVTEHFVPTTEGA